MIAMLLASTDTRIHTKSASRTEASRIHTDSSYQSRSNDLTSRPRASNTSMEHHIHMNTHSFITLGSRFQVGFDEYTLTLTLLSAVS
jgi:hypothetical protein